MRIVSLIPSATEIVCFLGLEEQLVGITHECDFPPTVRRLPVVTRSRVPPDLSSKAIDQLVAQNVETSHALFALDIDRLAQLNPDLIITQKLCDVCAVSEAAVLKSIDTLAHRPLVLQLEPHDLLSALEGIKLVAQAAECVEQGERKYTELCDRLHAVRKHGTGNQKPTVVLLEWIDPLFSAGHWNPEIIEIAGGREIIGKAREKSRRIAWRELIEADPEFLLIACCGYSVARAQRDLAILQKQAGFDQLRSARQGSIRVLDGSAYFNRPGPRLVDAAEMVWQILSS